MKQRGYKSLIAAVLLCALALAAFGGCRSGANPSATTGTQIPNPFTYYDSAEKAIAAYGQSVDTIGALPEGYEFNDAAVMNSDGSNFLQLIYNKSEDKLTFRASTDTAAADLNGDYDSYASSGLLSIAGLSVSTKDDDNGIRVATWERDGVGYCIMSEEALDSDKLAVILEGLNPAA